MIKTIHRLITKKDSNGRYRTELKITPSPEDKPVFKERKTETAPSDRKFLHLGTRIKHSRINGYKYHIQTIKCLDKETGNLITKEIIHRPL